VRLSFEERTYLVTGGGSGIGKGVAAGLVAAGASVMIVGRNADRLAAAVEEIESLDSDGGAIRYEPADGSLTVGPLTHTDSEAWRQTVDLNVNGTMYVLKHAARELVRGGGGSFVGISSIAASNTHRWFGPYGVTKSAIDHMMMLAADELGESWVRFNSIRPGLIRTDLVAASVIESPELSADYALCTPLPRTGEVEDVANLAMFLLSDAASWITGQCINVDGGHILRRGPDFSSLMEPMFGADALRGVI